MTAGLMAFGLVTPASAAQTPSPTKPAPAATPAAASTTGHKRITTTGLKPGDVKHVWLIILENKSYDATFTGLNQNSYLWKTLPSQGALLTHYYGTGHYSQDNYTSLVSGQATSFDLQADCDISNTDLGSNESIITKHKGKPFGPDDNYGQVMSLAGPNAPDGENGCTYPRKTPTLFNQFDAAGVTWKGYAQDLHAQAGREDALGGAPGSRENDPSHNPKSMKPSDDDKAKGISSFTGAQENDQYVAKHFPFPWFHSIVGNDNSGKDALTSPVDGGTMTDENHIQSVEDPNKGLLADLAKPADQVPAFNWITPNNCSDAHDATCKGNNLSGLFDENGEPDYSKPLSTPPKNHIGGLYAADLWLKYYIPLIEKSDAFKDGGLIDVTFDEANPPFTNMSFNNATDDSKVAKDASGNMLYKYSSPSMTELAEGYRKYAPNTFPNPSGMGKNFVAADAAGQNINGVDVDWEPTGPNTPMETDEHGNQKFPGPGDNGYITRPPSCEQDKDLINADASNCVKGAKNTGAGWGYGKAKTVEAKAEAGMSSVYAPVTVKDLGRKVTGTGIPEGAYIGAVKNEGPQQVEKSSDPITESSFILVDKNDKPLKTTGEVSEITMSATGIPGHLNEGESPLATFNAQDAAPGGGITGSVLISPLIKPGTVSHTHYNHYSWLRTMEDIFQVSQGTNNDKLPAGTVSGGLDGMGHLGYAAQAGLMPFGSEIFNNVSEEPSPSASTEPSPSQSTAPTPTATPSSSATPTTKPTRSSATPHSPAGKPGTSVVQHDDVPAVAGKPALPRTGR